MDMAFTDTGACNAQELSTIAQRGNVSTTSVAHGRTQATDELVQDRGNRPLEGHTALDTLGYQLERVRNLSLELTVGRTARHGTHGAHAAISLVAATLVEIDLSWALFRAG